VDQSVHFPEDLCCLIWFQKDTNGCRMQTAPSPQDPPKRLFICARTAFGIIAVENKNDIPTAFAIM
jgi:hypothetical protein